MDRRFLMVLGVSLVFAIVVSSVFYQMTSKAGPDSKKAENGELTDVVIAGRPLSIGLTIKSTDVKVVKLPKSAFPKGAFSKPEDVLDRPVMSNILLEEPILDGRLAQRGSGVGLAPVIPVGMRAVTVRVNDVVGVAGFVLPGMRVDILITGTPPGSSRSKVTKTVLQNLTVLSAGKTIQTDQTGKPVDAPNVTLMVSPQDAETLTLAGNEGHIQLVLRNGGDQNIEKTNGSSVAALYGRHARNVSGDQDGDDPDNPEPRPRPRARPAPPPVQIVAVAPPPPPPPPPVPDQIITIRGIDKKVETIINKKSSEDLGRNP